MDHETDVAPVSYRAAARAAIGLAFLLRLPAVSEPIGIDQGIFATAAWGITRGLMLYRDLWDQKPPGIHLAYLTGFHLFGFRPAALVWLDISAAAITAVLLFLIGRRLAGPRCGWLASAIYAAGTLPAAQYRLGGFLERAIPETFIAALASFAAFAIIRASENRRIVWSVMAGAAIGIAMLFKPTALIYWAAILAWYAIAHRGCELRVAVAGSIAGLALPLLAAAGWLGARGALTDAWVAIVDYNRAYVGGTGVLQLVDLFAHEFWRRFRTDPLWTLGVIGAAAGLVDVAIKRDKSNNLLPLVWLAGGVIAAVSNGTRMFNSYFVPSLPPLALLAGILFTRRLTRTGRYDGALRMALATLAVAFALRSGYLERVWQMTTADVAAMFRGHEGRLQYLEMFGGYANGRGYSARANEELTDYLAGTSSPSDRIFIFGMEPSVYFTSRRLPAQRFVWIGPVLAGFVNRDDFSLETVAREIDAGRTKYFIFERNNRDSAMGWSSDESFRHPAVQALLARYDWVRDVEDFTIYRLR